MVMGRDDGGLDDGGLDDGGLDDGGAGLARTWCSLVSLVQHGCANSTRTAVLPPILPRSRSVK